jgi:hypothetical protein
VLKKKIWVTFQRIIEPFTPKIVTKLLKIWVWDPGSEIRDPEKTYSGCNLGKFEILRKLFNTGMWIQIRLVQTRIREKMLVPEFLKLKMEPWRAVGARGLQFYPFFCFNMNPTENDRYWQKNKFLLFAKYLKIYSFSHLHLKLAKSVIITQKFSS